MKYSVHSHCGGEKAIASHIKNEIVQSIESVEIRPIRGAAPHIRDAILQQLKMVGWTGKVPVAKGSDITITTMREGVGLCLQTGNIARTYADLIKLQTLYLDDVIQAAVVIVPSKPVARLLGSNIAQAARLERELDIFKKAYHVPTLIYSLE